jgi:hypothetical protein
VPTPTISAIHAAVSLLNHMLQRQSGRLRVVPV